MARCSYSKRKRKCLTAADSEEAFGYDNRCRRSWDSTTHPPVDVLLLNFRQLTSLRRTLNIRISCAFAVCSTRFWKRLVTFRAFTDAAMNQEQPFEWTFGDFAVPFHVPGQAELEADQAPKMCIQPVSSDYFKTLQIPLLSGRDFDTHDQAGHGNVAVIDNAFAQRFFPNPVGRQIEDLEVSAGKLDLTIVGVVQNSRHNRRSTSEIAS